jgi:hypothetical protein
VSGVAFDASAATFPVVFATGPSDVVRRLRCRDVLGELLLRVARLRDVREEPFLPVDLLDLERPRADRLLEDRVVCAILIASLSVGFLAGRVCGPWAGITRECAI